MKKWMLSEAALMAKSEELQVAFPNLLARSLIDYILEKIAHSEEKQTIWIRNTEILDPVQWKEQVIHKIEVYDSSEYAAHLLEAAHQSTERKKEAVAEYVQSVESYILRLINAEGQISVTHESQYIEEKNQVKIFMNIQIERMQVALQWTSVPVQSVTAMARLVSIRLVTEVNKCIELYEFAPDIFLADQFIYILEYMELVNHMEAYANINRILQQESISGRKVRDYIAEYLKEKDQTPALEKWNTIVQYRTNSFMIKKWNYYLRRNKKKTPEWAEVIDRIHQFFGCIWEAIVKDEVFLGDWMPELSRFMD